MNQMRGKVRKLVEECEKIGGELGTDRHSNKARCTVGNAQIRLADKGDSYDATLVSNRGDTIGELWDVEEIRGETRERAGDREKHLIAQSDDGKLIASHTHITDRLNHGDSKQPAHDNNLTGKG